MAEAGLLHKVIHVDDTTFRPCRLLRRAERKRHSNEHIVTSRRRCLAFLYHELEPYDQSKTRSTDLHLSNGQHLDPRAGVS